MKPLQKIGFTLASLWCIITLTFVMMKSIPGDPFVEEKSLPAEVREHLRNHYGLNDPWYKQYAAYLASVLKWDFGPSFRHQDRSVNTIISEGFAVSALLGLEALALAIFGGISLGVLAALHKKGWQDYIVHLLTTFSISVPSFILAVLLQYLLATKYKIFPIARWGTFSHTVLPALALSLMPMAFIARLMRSNMLEVLNHHYIRTAISKGLPYKTVIKRHALKNAIAPILPYLGQLTANILIGSFVVEKIFSIPGLGQWFVNSVSTRDYTVIMGMTVFYSIILLTALLIADLIHMKLDPRIAETPS